MQKKFVMKKVLIVLSPALFFSCSLSLSGSPGTEPDTVMQVPVKFQDGIPAADQREGYIADIFVFNDDRLQRLDSYQRIACGPGEMPSAASQTGKKIIAAIVNPQSGSYSWEQISSFQALGSMVAELKKESGQKMLMSGYGHAEAGKDAMCEIDVSPLASEVMLRSVRCDFSGKPYRGTALKEVRAYLTNVNAEAKLLQQEGFVPETICNQGRLRKEDVMEFTDQSLIVRKIANEIGTDTVYPGISFMCYPNECMEETAGSPFTRLVIEGMISGQTCYYPVNINRTGPAGGGISRNCRYVFDITIKSTGSSDPDVAVSPEDIDISCMIAPWDEKDGTEIIF